MQVGFIMGRHEGQSQRRRCDDGEGRNRQNRLCLESRSPSWAGLWTLSYRPSIYGNDIPTGKPGSQKEKPQGLYLDSPAASKNTLIICVTK